MVASAVRTPTQTVQTPFLDALGARTVAAHATATRLEPRRPPVAESTNAREGKSPISCQWSVARAGECSKVPWAAFSDRAGGAAEAPNRSGVRVRAGATALSTRRELLAWGAVLSAGAVPAAPARADELLEVPLVGDCVECVGVMEGLLNSCPPDTVSCVSSQNDDEEHFIKPWVYEGDRQAAMDRLIDVATGGAYDPGFVAAPYGVSRAQAAGFILKTTAAFVTGDELPEKPKRARAKRVARQFDATLVERDDAEGYVRLTLYPDESVSYDAEFIFLDDDELCDIRVSARGDRTQNKVDISFEDIGGLKLVRNGSRVVVDDLRKALAWDEAVVITSFDARFNSEKKFWFEKSFEALNLAPPPGAPAGAVVGGSRDWGGPGTADP